MTPSNKEVYARLLVLKGVVTHALMTPRLVLSDLYLKWSEKEQHEFEQNNREQTEALIKNLKNIGAWGYASPKEVTFLQSYAMNMNPQQHINAVWRKECASMFMWALGLRETWPNIDQETTPDEFRVIPEQKIGLFSQFPNLKPKKEILKKRELVEAWHWRVRTRQLIEEGHPFPLDNTMEKAGFHSYDDIVRFSAKAHYRDGDLTKIIDEDFVYVGKAYRSLTTEEYQISKSIISERHFALNWLCGMAPGNRWDETPTPT
jgi:hypothetical protein